MKLTPIEHPWTYLKELQESFDYEKIKYTEDYYDVDMNPTVALSSPEWKVRFEGGFFGGRHEKNAPEQKSDWTGNLTGQDIIG